MYQIVEVLADLPDDAGEGRPEQLLHVVGPGAVPVVRLQVVNPLHRKEDIYDIICCSIRKSIFTLPSSVIFDCFHESYMIDFSL